MLNRYLVSAVIAATIGLHVLTPCEAAAAPAPFAHESSDLAPNPAVRWGRLGNGVRFAVMRNARPEQRASLRLGVMTGSLQETDAQRGLAHFLEHLAFNGSKHFAPGTLVDYLQRQGMAMGADTNAMTGFDRTIYQLELASSSEQTLQQAITLLTDFQGGLLLEPASIEKERGIILAEKRDSESPGQRQWAARAKFTTPALRSVQRLPIGEEDVIRSAGRDQFLDYYDTWYRPENIVVIAVGDFDAAKVEAQIRKAFGSLVARAPARAAPELGRVEPIERPIATFFNMAEIATVDVGADIVAPHAPQQDSLAKRRGDVARTVAIALMNRRLSLLSKQEHSVILGGQFHHGSEFDAFKRTSLDVSCRASEPLQACLGAMQLEIARALEDGFDPQEMREVVTEMRKRIEQSVHSESNASSSMLANMLMSSVLDREVFTTAADDISQITPTLDKLTAAQCVAALRDIWSGVPRLFVSSSGKISDTDILAAWNKGASEAKVVAAAAQQLKFAYDNLGAPAKIVVRQEVADLGLSLLQLSNGVRLNLKRTDFESGRIHVGVRVGDGSLSAPRDKPGLTMLAANAFIAGGLGKHSRDDLRSLLAGRSVGYAFNVQGEAFGLGGSTTPEDLLLQLQLLCAFLTDPGYRPEALREFRQGFDQVFTSMAHSLDAAQKSEIPVLLANGNPWFGFPERAQLEQRDLNELRAWLGPQLAHGALEISIVGSFDIDKTVGLVQRTFGALPQREARQEYAAQRRVSYPPKPLSERFVADTDVPRAIVDIRWPATDSLDTRRARGIGLLTSIFSDRVWRQLREKMGQAYSPRVSAQLSDMYSGYGFIVANASVAPEQADVMAAAIKSVALDLATQGVTQDELNRAREPMLNHAASAEHNNGYWMQVLSHAQEHPKQLDDHRSRLSDMRSIDIAEVNALAKQYLDPARASVFVMTPKQGT